MNNAATNGDRLPILHQQITGGAAVHNLKLAMKFESFNPSVDYTTILEE
jgi:hypothetical protein